MEEERITGNLEWDGLHRPQLFYAMGAVWCGIFLSVVDGNICNVALPVIAQELGVSVVMMALLPFSTLGELYSYKKVYLSGVAVFTVASVFCMVSHSLLMLVASRAFQGLGAAMMMSVNTSVAKLVFPRRHFGKGVGINATVVALSAVSGPSIAAAILSFASWPWLFAINIPVGIVTFLMGWRFLPDNPTHIVGRRFHIGDALLNAAVFGLLIGCIEMYSHDVSPAVVTVAAAVLLVLGFLYIRSQLRRRYPMLPFDLLRIPAFSMSVTTSVVSYTAQMMVLVGMPFMLLHTFGMNPVETVRLAEREDSPRPARRIRPAADECRLFSALVHSGGRLSLRHRLETRPLRCRFRILPVAQQPSAPELRAQPPGRQCKRHALHRPPDRPGHRRSFSVFVPDSSAIASGNRWGQCRCRPLSVCMLYPRFR